MTKHIGDIDLPNTSLHYDLLGNAEDGYCIEITSCKFERACGFISSDLRFAEKCVKLLYEGMAFPCNLKDYLEDFIPIDFPVGFDYTVDDPFQKSPFFDG